MNWPERPQLLAYGRFLLIFSLIFFPTYFTAGKISVWSGRAMGAYFSWETQIPLLPWMIIPYLSLYLAFLLPVVHLNKNELASLERQSILALSIAFAIFIALPGQLGFPPKNVVGAFALIFEIIGKIDTPHNLAPSLHVTFGALILCACADQTTSILRKLYFAWLVILAVSTVLVHQHHLLDVLTGLGLAALVRRYVPLSGRSTGLVHQ